MLKILREDNNDTVTIKEMCKKIEEMYLEQFPYGRLFGQFNIGTTDYVSFSPYLTEHSSYFRDDIFDWVAFNVCFEDEKDDEGKRRIKKDSNFKLVLFSSIKIKNGNSHKYINFLTKAENNNSPLIIEDIGYNEMLDYLDNFFSDLYLAVSDLLASGKLDLCGHTKEEIEKWLSGA